MSKVMRLGVVVSLAGLICLPSATLGEQVSSPTAAEMKPVVDKAFAYLKAHQDADGSFSRQLGGPGVTALVVAALIRHGHGPEDPMVAKALKYLESSIQKDGGIYDRILANYTTSVAILALKEANTDGRYDAIIKNSSAFLRSIQHDEQQGSDPTKPEYGGAGYDGKSRPDLSNTQFFVAALKASGIPPDDPAMKRALVFISRCQNLPGEHNDQPFARKVGEEDRGGFIYTPAGGGRSNAGRTPEGGLRSAGVMTYAGLMSFPYAGVDAKDARVQAAFQWMRSHYTLDENPGQGQAGLYYYYYHTFAKAMSALGNEQFEDNRGTKHYWKRDLFEALKRRQLETGTWSNATDRFGETDGNLCAAYALLALSYCKSAEK